MARPIEKRQQIEDAVVRVVAEKGLHATTTQDLAEAAVVSPGLLYRYWENREQLARAVYQKHYLALTERLGLLVAEVADPVEKLRVMIRAFLEFAAAEPLILRFLLLSQHDLARSVPQELGVRPFLKRLMSEAIAQGRIRPMNPDLAVQMLMGMVLQPVIGVAYGHLAGPVTEHFDVMFEAILRALGTPGDSAIPGRGS